MKGSWKMIILLTCLLLGSMMFGLGQAAQNLPSAQTPSYLPLIFRDFSAVMDQIAFIGVDPNIFENQFIFLINEDGDRLHNLTMDPASSFMFEWSPDGLQIAFSVYRGGNYDIYLINADGSGLVNLTNNPAQDHHPYWSADGAQIAFISDRQASLQVYVMDSDGSNVTQLTDLTPGCTKPVWSPDGSMIVFDLLGDMADDEEIYVMNSDGTGQMRLSNNDYYDTVEDWSPDGTKILFLSDRASINSSDVFVMNKDGTNPVRLTPYPTVTGARWSPDGSKIAYYSYNYPFSIMASDGSANTILLCQSEEIQPASASWSPDGKKLAFSPIPGSNLEDGIYVTRVDNTSCNRLTTTRAWDPQWRP